MNEIIKTKGKSNKDIIDNIFSWIFKICAVSGVVIVVLITGYMVITGGPAMFEVGILEFLFGSTWAPTASDPSYGILPMILSTLYGAAAAIVIGVPIGLLTSVYVTYMAPKKVTKLIESCIELLAGIPSVIYGFVGLIVVVPAVASFFNISFGMNLFSAIIVLSVMILPTIINISKVSLQALPEEHMQGSLALGATKTQTIFKVLIPAAKSGILTGVVLGIGRAIGETMAVMMVSGNSVNFPELFGSVRFLTTGIVSEMSYSSGIHRELLFSIGLVLFAFIMIINFSITKIGKREAKDK